MSYPATPTSYSHTPFPVAHGKVGGSDSPDFPVLVVGSGTQFKLIASGGRVANASGFDIQPFADTSAATAYDYQLVSFDGSAGTFAMWVRVPITHLADAPIHIFAGDSSLTTDGSVRTTWKAAYLRVHNYGTPTVLDMSDVSQSNITATNNLCTAGTGIFSGGIVNTGLHSVATTAISLTGAFSLSVWFNSADHTGARMLFSDNAQVAKFGTNGAQIFARVSSTGGADQSVAAPSTGAWHFAKLIRDGSNVAKLSIDGGAYTTLTAANASGTWTLTKLSDTFNGTQDSQRISTDVDSADWTLAEYNNLNDPSTFAVQGAEVPPVAGATQLAVTTAPVVGASGSAFTTAPVVTIQAADGSTVVTDTSTVTATISVLTGSVSLVGATTAVAVAGVATFSTLGVSGTGTFTITFTDGVLTAATTATLSVTAPAASTGLGLFGVAMSLSYGLLDGYDFGVSSPAPVEPVYAGSNTIHAADSSAYWYTNPGIAGSQTTWTPGTVYGAGDYVANSSTSTAFSDMAIDATDNTQVTSATLLLNGSAYLGFQIYITSGAGFTPGNYWVVGIDGSKATLSSTYFGPPAAVGTTSSTGGTGIAKPALANNVYICATAGTSGTGGGPVAGSGTNFAEPAPAGTAKWTWVISSTSAARYIPETSRLVNSVSYPPDRQFIIAGKDGVGKAGRVIYKAVNAWAQSTAYAVGDYIVANTNVYYGCVIAGTSSGSGTGPSATTSHTTDGTVTWRYLGTSTAAQQGGAWTGYHFTSKALSLGVHLTAYLRLTYDSSDPRIPASGGPALKFMRWPSTPNGSGGAAIQFDIHDHSPWDPIAPVALRPAYFRAVAGGTDNTHPYPVGCDQATQPTGPWPLDLMSLAPSWHKFTWSFKSPSDASARDGWARCWVDGVQILDDSAWGLNRPGGEKQWCGIDCLIGDGVGGSIPFGLNKYIGDSTDPTYCFFFGGTNTGSGILQLTYDVNFGTVGHADNTVAWFG